MPISILHVGLPLDHPLIPPEERPKILNRLQHLQQSMTEAGFLYEIFTLSPGTGLEPFTHRLNTHPCDAVLIGGALSGEPTLSYFLEQIIDTTHHAVPHAKILFFSHAVDVRTTVERWFPPPAGS